jgi:hypothetical protein
MNFRKKDLAKGNLYIINVLFFFAILLVSKRRYLVRPFASLLTEREGFITKWVDI